MGKTYSCTLGCDFVFTRQYQLRKHMATHNDPDSLFYCPTCPFYTFDKRNLKTHMSQHTGNKDIECPDTIEVRDSPGSTPREEACPYRTHDPSLLIRHRKKKHGYIPRSRSAPQSPTTFALVSSTISVSTATGRTTSRAKKPKQVRKQKDVKRTKTSQARAARKSKKSTGIGRGAPSTSQEVVVGSGSMANANSSDATISSSSSSNATEWVASRRGTSSVAHGRLAHINSSSATGHANTIPVTPNQGVCMNLHGQSTHNGSSYPTGHGNTMSVAPPQGVPNAYGLLEHVNSLEAGGYSNTMSIIPNRGVPSTQNAWGHQSYTQPLAATGPIFAANGLSVGSTASVAPRRGMLVTTPFVPATNTNWAPFYVGGSAVPSMTGVYNPAVNLQMNAFALPVGRFQMNNGAGVRASAAGIPVEGLYPPVWNSLWAQYAQAGNLNSF